MVPFDRVDVEAGWHAADQLVRAKATAILSLCSSPVSAGVVSCLNDRGLELPTDISLIVYDERFELSAAMRPGLSALVRPLEEYAHLAGQLLTARLADPHLPHRVEVVGTRLNVRDSTGPPPARSRRRPTVPSHATGVPSHRKTRETRPSTPIVT